jgi:hypothetical protein
MVLAVAVAVAAAAAAATCAIEVEDVYCTNQSSRSLGYSESSVAMVVVVVAAVEHDRETQRFDIPEYYFAKAEKVRWNYR